MSELVLEIDPDAEDDWCGWAKRMSRTRGGNVYQFLNAAFLEAMNDIGRYGNDKYGEDSFHQRAKRGDASRGNMIRTTAPAIAEHAADHFRACLRGERHDHFGTRKHQLAAAAFNAMMEFYFAGLEREGQTTEPPSE